MRKNNIFRNFFENRRAVNRAALPVLIKHNGNIMRIIRREKAGEPGAADFSFSVIDSALCSTRFSGKLQIPAFCVLCVPV